MYFKFSLSSEINSHNAKWKCNYFFALQISLFFATKVLFTLNCTKPLFLLNKHYGWNFQILFKQYYASFHTSEI